MMILTSLAHIMGSHKILCLTLSNVHIATSMSNHNLHTRTQKCSETRVEPESGRGASHSDVIHCKKWIISLSQHKVSTKLSGLRELYMVCVTLKPQLHVALPAPWTSSCPEGGGCCTLHCQWTVSACTQQRMKIDSNFQSTSRIQVEPLHKLTSNVWGQRKLRVLFSITLITSCKC